MPPRQASPACKSPAPEIPAGEGWVRKGPGIELETAAELGYEKSRTPRWSAALSVLTSLAYSGLVHVVIAAVALAAGRLRLFSNQGVTGQQ